MGWFEQKPEIWALFIVYLTFVVLLYTKRLPPIESVSKFVSLADTKGGNILIVGMLFSWSLVLTLRYAYTVMHVVTHSISTNTPLPPSASSDIVLNWMTGSITMGLLGALLKTTTGTTPDTNHQSPTPTSVAISASTPTGGNNAENPQP